MSIAEEAIAKIKSADDAGVVAAQIMSHFGLAGTVFIPEDVTERLVEEYEIELDSDELTQLSEEYMNTSDWKYINDRTTEVANEILSMTLAEFMREREG